MEDLVLGVAKSLVEGGLTKVQSAIAEESRLRESAQQNLIFFAIEFQMMLSFLSATTEEQLRNNLVSTMVKQVRDLTYDVEDCVEFLVHLDTKSDWWRRVIPLPLCMAPTLPLDEAVASIENLKARVQYVSQSYARYNLSANSAPPAFAASHMLANATTDEEKKTVDMVTKYVLTDQLTEGNTDLQVISVWATGGGLGAMATIRKAYDDPTVWVHFRCRAWVKLPRPFSLHEFIRSVLDQFYTSCSEENYEASVTDVLKRMKRTVMADEDLVMEFMDQVMNNTYLIVLEDLSNIAEWEAIRNCLPNKSNRSRIVISTYEFEIANLCTGLPYFQRFSADHSLCVFFKESRPIRQKASMGPRTASLAQVNFVGHLVGRKPEMHNLLHYLNKALFDDLHVMSVWGIAGSGKSALVKTFYREKLMRHPAFYKRGWVDVPHPYNSRELCQSLLLSLISSDFLEANETIKCDDMGIRDPVEECRVLVEVNKCVVVIDNLQSKEEWDLIQAALVSRRTKSIIIVITNDASIASHCADREELVLNVKGLEFEAAMDLFRMEAQKQQQIINTEFFKNDVVVDQIVSKCGGLPKLIVAAAQFVFKILYQWIEKADMMNTKFMHNLENSPEFAHVRGIFGWMRSYFRTCPDLLRPCIFYLSIFPKSQAIRRRRLVLRWVSEGYSKDNGNSTAEKNAEELFAKLIELTMIQPPERKTFTDRRMVMCQVSAFFYEYIISRPKQDNVTFALEVLTLDRSCRQITGRTGRHLVIERSWERDRNVFESIDFSRLRSLTVFGKWESFFISSNMKVLRVLDLENAFDVTDEDLEKAVKLLTRLKFLSLRGFCKISHLPKSLDGLRQLQILDVRHTSIITLQASIIKLKKLQYISAGTNAIVPYLVP